MWKDEIDYDEGEMMDIEKEIQTSMECIITDYLKVLEIESKHELFQTESDMKCYLYGMIRDKLRFILEQKHAFLYTEYLLEDQFKVDAEDNSYKHPRIDLAILNLNPYEKENIDKLRILYGIELKFSYYYAAKGKAAFVNDIERVKKLNKNGKLQAATCLWFESYYSHQNQVVELKKEIEALSEKSIRCIYVNTAKD